MTNEAIPEHPDMKPCPFCGHTPDPYDDSTFETNNVGKWGFVLCCIQGPEVRTGFNPLGHWRRQAIDAWNTRA